MGDAVELQVGDKVRVIKNEYWAGAVGMVVSVSDYRPVPDSILGRVVHVDLIDVGQRVFHLDSGDQLQKEDWTSEEQMAMNMAAVERDGF